MGSAYIAADARGAFAENKALKLDNGGGGVLLIIIQFAVAKEKRGCAEAEDTQEHCRNTMVADQLQ